jgi:hypothetical protein
VYEHYMNTVLTQTGSKDKYGVRLGATYPRTLHGTRACTAVCVCVCARLFVCVCVCLCVCLCV